jgi:hypothetical protein
MIPRNALRLLIDVDGSQNDTALLEIAQGTKRLDVPANPYGHVTIDAAP